jgi:hypothetical protein
MAKPCPICSLEPRQRLRIDRPLTSGASVTEIARKYGFTRRTVDHHKNKHLRRQLVTSASMAEKKHGLDLFQDLVDLKTRAQNILDRVELDGKDALALKAVASVRDTVESFGKMGLLKSLAGGDGPQFYEEQRADMRQKLASLPDDKLQAFLRLMDRADLLLENRDPSEYSTVMEEPSRLSPELEAELAALDSDTEDTKPKRRQKIEAYDPAEDDDFSDLPDKDPEGFTMSDRMKRRPRHEIENNFLLDMKTARRQKQRKPPRGRFHDPFLDAIATGKARVKTLV